MFESKQAPQFAAFLLIKLLLFNSLCWAFTEQTVYFETVEEQPPSTLIGTFSTLSNHTYRISGNDESKQYIDLDLVNGTIKVKRKIDREKLRSDRLSLALIDENSLSITALKIQVKDINDNSPQFPSSFYNVSLLESVPLGARISLPAAIDPDKAENGTIIAYELQHPSSTFALAASNGNESASLYLINSLDREQNSTYELVLFALDGGKPKRQGQMTIFVNVQDSNEVPRFEEQDYNVTVNAKVSANQTLLQVKAIDVDSGENGQLSYRIQNDLTNQFLIDDKNGKLFVKSNVDFLHCNRSNGQNVCLITVEAIDGGDPPLKARQLVRIVVNESSSYVPTLKIRTYPLGFDSAFVSTNAKPDTVVAVLTSNANLSIVSGNEGNWFRLESGSSFGIIRLVRLEPILTKQTYELVIRARGKEMPLQTIQETLKLTVYDNLAKYRYLDEISNQTYSICKGLPCYGGTCGLNAGCQCSASHGGFYCNERMFAFKFGSSLQIRMPEHVGNFSMQFRSASSNGLLFYSRSTNNSYFAIEVLNGQLHLIGQINSQPVSTNTIQINDSNNYTTLKFDFNDNTIVVSVNPEENCSDCSWTIDKQMFNNTIFIGATTDQQHPFANSNFYGCVKSIQINNQPLSPSLIIGEHFLMQTCPFDAQQPTCSRPEAQLACQHGRCQSSWEGFYCICGDGFEAMDCRPENQTLVNGQLRLTPSLYSRQKLTIPNNNSFIRDLGDRPLYSEHNSVRQEHWSQDESVSLIDRWPSQWIELDIRTNQLNSTFFATQTAEHQAQLGTINGQLYYTLIDSNRSAIASLHLNSSTFINDKRWHRITIEIAADNRSIRLRIDDLYVDSFMDVNFPQFLSSDLDSIEVGSPSFRGCIRRLLVNNQFYPLDNSKMLDKQFFQLLTVNGTLSSSCTDFTVCSIENDCSMGMLLHGISVRELIIVSIALLLIFLCILIGLQIRRRFQKQKLLTNIQRIHNLQLISTSDSEYGYNNATYSSNADFAYLPSYIPVYSNISYPSNDICSCHLKFDYEDNVHKFVPSQYFLQDGVVTRFGLNELSGSHDCSISSSSTDIPLDPPTLTNLAERDYTMRRVQ